MTPYHSTPTRFAILIITALALIASPLSATDEDPGLFARLNQLRLEWIEDTDAWFHAGPAGVYVNLQDTRMSPLRYSGPGPGFALSADLVREHWLWLHSAAIRYALPRASDEQAGTYMSISGEADVSLLYRIGGTNLAAGGAVRGGAHLRTYDRLQNNSYNSDVIVALNASGRWEVPFDFLSRSLVFHVGAVVPAFSWISRSPAYATHGSASFWAPPARYFRTTLESGLTWTLAHAMENVARVKYTWDFYTLREFDGLHTLGVATHTLSLSVGTRYM